MWQRPLRRCRLPSREALLSVRGRHHESDAGWNWPFACQRVDRPDDTAGAAGEARVRVQEKFLPGQHLSRKPHVMLHLLGSSTAPSVRSCVQEAQSSRSQVRLLLFLRCMLSHHLCIRCSVDSRANRCVRPDYYIIVTAIAGPPTEPSSVFGL